MTADQPGSLTDFLLARIAEDEAAAEFIHDSGCFLVDFPDRGWCQCGQRGRAHVEAICKAHRRIVDLHELDDATDGPHPQGCTICDAYGMASIAGRHAGGCDTLRVLAAIYADHPDYRPEWVL